MRKKIEKFKHVSFIIFLIMVCTGFTDFEKQISPTQGEYHGVADPEVGIIVRIDSTAIDVMKESSNHIRFNAVIYFEDGPIGQLTLPLDFKPKKFTFSDKNYGFSGITYRMIANFRDHGKNPHGKLEEVTIYPIDPSEWREKEEILKYLDNWVKIIDEAGWKQTALGWNRPPYQLPEKEGFLQGRPYMQWEASINENLYHVLLRVQRLEPSSYGNKFKEPRYNFAVYLIRYPKELYEN